jgi:hypothetical protein
MAYSGPVTLSTSGMLRAIGTKEGYYPSLENSADFTVQLVEALFEAGTVDIGDTTYFTDASTVSEGSIVRWQWDFDGDGVTDATGSDAKHLFNEPGTHEVTLTVTTNLDFTASYTGSVLVNAVGVESLWFESLKVYPNPVADKLFVEAAGNRSDVMRLKITDLSGRLLTDLQLKDASGAFRREVDVSGLVQGTYFLELSHDGGRHVVPFIKR